MLLLATYSLGLALPFFLAGWSVELLLASAKRLKRHFRRIEIVSGALLIALGVLVATNRLTALNSYFFFLNDVVEAAERWLL
jgi:cytochrome c-type biogenesis protein